MGWWSHTIMGGDTPLDYVGFLADELDVEYDGDYGEGSFHGYRFTRDVLEAPGVHGKIKAAHENCYNDVVFGEVVGAVYLWAGAAIPAPVKKGILTCAKAELEDCESRKTGFLRPDERAGYLRDLIEKIEAHKPGERVELVEEGLFENMAKMLCGEGN